MSGRRSFSSSDRPKTRPSDEIDRIARPVGGLLAWCLSPLSSGVGGGRMTVELIAGRVWSIFRASGVAQLWGRGMESTGAHLGQLDFGLGETADLLRQSV